MRGVDRDEWLARRTYRGADFDPERLADQARRRPAHCSLPALGVGDTVGRSSPPCARLVDEP
jgi:hypothetical protein